MPALAQTLLSGVADKGLTLCLGGGCDHCGDCGGAVDVDVEHKSGRAPEDPMLTAGNNVLHDVDDS